MAITALPGWKVDPNNPNGVIQDNTQSPALTPLPGIQYKNPWETDPTTGKQTFNASLQDSNGYPTATGGGGTKPATEPTTLYSGNINDKVIPQANDKLNSLTSSTGPRSTYMDPSSGFMKYTDDNSLVQAPIGATPNGENNTWEYNGQVYSQGPAFSGDPHIDAITAAQMENTDSVTRGLIKSIQTQYAAYKQQQKQINAGQEGGINKALLMGGSSRYAPVSSEGTMATQMSYGLNQIAALEAKEQSLIAEAKNAQLTKNFEAMSKAADAAENIRKEKIAATQELNKKIADANLQLGYEKQVQDAINNGATDSASAFKALAGKVPIKTIDDIFKSWGAGAVDVKKQIGDLVTAARNNGAPADVVTKILASKNLTEAINAAGDYGSGGTGIVGEYNFYKAQEKAAGRVPVDFNTYQNQDANRKARAVNGTLPVPDTSSPELGAVGNDILSTAGLSIAAFNYLTQGTASMSRMPAEQRNQILNEAQAWAKKKGIDVSTFQSQYKAYNDVLSKNISRANQTQIMAGEVAGSADSLISAIDEQDWNKMGNVKVENVVKLLAGQQVNDPTTMKYSFQIKAMANDLAGYFAAARGAPSPELQDQRDAAEVISNGLNKKSVTAFKDSVITNEEKVAEVVQKAVDSTRKQVWGLFGVADKYKSTPTTPTTGDQLAVDESKAQQKVIDYGKTNPDAKQHILELSTQISPETGRPLTFQEIMQILGIK